MSRNIATRRQFLVAASGSLAATALGLCETPPDKRLRLGAPTFAKTQDPEELARAHVALGYRAAYCPKVDITETDRIRAIRDAFTKNDIIISEVGRWLNLLDADPAKRKENLEKVTSGLALADEIGALCCVDIAGSFNEKIWYGPDPRNLTQAFFDATVENARKIIDAVKPKRAKLCYEMMGWSLPDSPDSYLRMLKAVDRPAFGVHLDPCNLINSPERFYKNADLLRECFEKLGPHIVSCHAKDLSWEVEMNVHFVEVGPGLGQVDYAAYLKGLASLPHRPPLMIEHLKTAEDYAAAAKYIRGVGEKIGLAF
ncbi:MAG TPA: sugar phosphate isomerase/epimerase [Verrucomicrobiae bacterium]|nr:sugar phosphate isomerase/epimerase [Verrucomicrobiae bacterium]